jgi:adhesin transport system membrane fusion protein
MTEKHSNHLKQSNAPEDSGNLDFMAEVDAMQRMKAVPAANALLITITILLVFFVFWASFFKIEEIVRGQGQVEPSSELQVVQSLEGGILSDLLVREGDLVEEGQPLAQIKNEAFASEERGIEGRYHALQLKQLRLKALASGDEFIIPDGLKDRYTAINESEVALHRVRLEEISTGRSILEDKVKQADAALREVQAQVRRWKQNQGLLSKELRMTRNLAAQKAVPQLDVIRLERDVNEISGNIEAGAEKIAALSAEARGNKSQLAEYDLRVRAEALKEITDTQTGIAALQESLSSAGDRVDRTLLTAPTAGIVKKVHVTTLGGVIEPAMRFIEIVPVEDDLKITAQVNPSDIAFLSVGQPVNVKITAYDSQRFGALEGELTRISADSEKDDQGNMFFEIDVRTTKNYLGSAAKPLPITPGMIAETEIITGKRSIMTYLLKPFLRARDRALTEK